jgi:hypothetical protein
LRQAEQESWGHFMVRVRQTPQGTVWEIEALTSGASASFQSPRELVAFIRANLKPKEALPAEQGVGKL